MNVTNVLMAMDPTLERHNEGKWQEPFNADLPGFSSFNDAGIECETGEFLYAMVRMLKPSRVLETGTHWGVGASYMGLALAENNHGELDTVEFIPEIWHRAKSRIATLGLDNIVTCHLGNVAEFLPPEDWRGSNESIQDIGGVQPRLTYDLILLDTEPQTRFAELIKFFEYLNPGGFVFIHDLHRHMHQIENEEHGFAWPYGPLPEAIKNMVLDDELRPFHFSTPRGLTGFYKPSKQDHPWRK